VGGVERDSGVWGVSEIITNTIAFVTHTEWPNLTPDDQLAVQALTDRGIEVQPALWDDPRVDWSDFGKVVIRSTWDYHNRVDEFRAWLQRLQEKKVQVWNPISTLRWNMDKKYLRDLDNSGVPVVPSVWAEKDESIRLSEEMRANGWKSAVVKPVISASAHNTWVAHEKIVDEVQVKLDALLLNGGALIQEFMPEIQAEGEWSLMFFNKEYSHAAIKRPRENDFRVQWEHGGSATAAEAPADLITHGQRVVDSVDGPLLYARVDGVVRDGHLYLMELELIEPFLFFGYHPQAAERFAEAVFKLT
jgi:glutathione synthase/RimK-type ligase-like ATP-grasp enzyme